MKHKQLLGIASALSLAYLLFLIFTFPATWVFSLLRDAGAPIAATRINGTVWSGQAAGFTLALNNRPVKLGDLNWEVNPLYLLVGKAHLSFHGGDGSADTQYHGNLTMGWFSARVRDLDLKFPLQRMHGIYAPSAIIGLSGKTRVAIDELQIDGDHFAIRGNISVDQVSSNFTANAPAADYVIAVSSENNVLMGNVSTLKGIPAVSGKITWRPLDSGRATFDGSINAGRNPALRKLLAQMGQPDASGAIKLRWNGRLFRLVRAGQNTG